MPLRQNEIKDCAFQFSKNWSDESRELAEAQTFWTQVFGFSRGRFTQFEVNLTTNKLTNGRSYLSWKGNILAEHNFARSNHNRAYQQSIVYFLSLRGCVLPALIIFCDFQNSHVYYLNKVVDLCFRSHPFSKNSSRIEYLFYLYKLYT